VGSFFFAQTQAYAAKLAELFVRMRYTLLNQLVHICLAWILSFEHAKG
jgi:hypothetical protein